MPDGKKIHFSEFAQKIKAKYPDYKDVDDRVLAEKMISKYSEYADQVTFDEKKKDLQSSSVSPVVQESGDVQSSLGGSTSPLTDTGSVSQNPNIENPFSSVIQAAEQQMMARKPQSIIPEQKQSNVDPAVFKNEQGVPQIIPSNVAETISNLGQQQNANLQSASTNLSAPVDQKNALPEGTELNPDLGREVTESLARGSASLGSMLARTPAFLYDLAATPFNYVMSGRFQNDLSAVPIDENSELGKSLGLDKNPLTAEKFAEQLGLGNNLVAEHYEKIVNESRKQMQQKYDKTITEYFDSGQWDKGLSLLANSVAETAPVSISLAMGNAAGASPAASILGGGSVFGAGKKQEINESGVDLPENEKNKIALANGLVEGIFEQFGVSKLGTAVRKVYMEEGQAAARNAAESWFAKVFGPTMEKYLGVASEEAITEAATQFAQNSIDKYSGYKPEMDLSEGVSDAAMIGFASGAGFSMVPSALQAARRKESVDKVNQITEEKKALEADLNSPAVSPEARATISKKIGELNQQEAQINREEKARYEALSDEEKAQVNKHMEKINELTTTALDQNVSEQTREIITKEIQQNEKQVDKIFDSNKDKKEETVRKPIKSIDDVDIGATIINVDGKKGEVIGKENNQLVVRMETGTMTANPKVVEMFTEEKAPAQEKKSGVEITNFDKILEDGSGRVEVSKNGQSIAFDKFDISIDKENNTAEIANVEKKDRAANKGIGVEAYIELGNRLAEKGITLESVRQPQNIGGKHVWDQLLKLGFARKDGQGVYSFVSQQQQQTEKANKEWMASFEKEVINKEKTQQTQPAPEVRDTEKPTLKEGDKYTDHNDIERVWGEDKEADKAFEIAKTFELFGDAATIAGARQTAKNFDKGVSFTKPAAIEAAQKNAYYNVEIQEDGSAKVIGVFNPDTNQWMGTPKPEKSITNEGKETQKTEKAGEVLNQATPETTDATVSENKSLSQAEKEETVVPQREEKVVSKKPSQELIDEEEELDAKKGDDKEAVKKLNDDIEILKKFKDADIAAKKFTAILEKAFKMRQEGKISRSTYTQYRNKAQQILGPKVNVDAEAAKMRIEQMKEALKKKLLGEGYNKILLSSPGPFGPRQVADLIDLTAEAAKKAIDAGFAIKDAVQKAIDFVKKHPSYNKLVEAGQLNEDEFSKAVNEVFSEEESPEGVEKTEKEKPQEADIFGEKRKKGTAERIEKSGRYDEIISEIEEDDKFYESINAKKAVAHIEGILDKFEADGLLEDLSQDILEDNNPFHDKIKNLAAGMLVERLRVIAEKEGNEMQKKAMNVLAAKVWAKRSDNVNVAATQTGLEAELAKLIPKSVEGLTEWTKAHLEQVQNTHFSEEQRKDVTRAVNDISALMETEEAKKAIRDAVEEELDRIAEATKGKDWVDKVNKALDEIKTDLTDC